MKNDTPAVGFAFMLRVEGVHDIACRAVRGFRQEYEYENIQEGGLNDYVHSIRKPISKPYTFTVERYVGIELADRLPIGTEFIAPLLLFVRGYGFSGKKGEVDPIVRTYAFTGAKVIGKDYGDLDAENSKLVVETTTIAYQEMMKINLPTDGFFGKIESFSNIKKRIEKTHNTPTVKPYKHYAEDIKTRKEIEKRMKEALRLLTNLIRSLLGKPAIKNSSEETTLDRMWEMRRKKDGKAKLYPPTYSELTADTLSRYASRMAEAQKSDSYQNKIDKNNSNKKKPVKVKPYSDYVKQNIESKEGRESVEAMAAFIAEIMNAMSGKPKEKSAHDEEIDRIKAEWEDLKKLAPIAFEELVKETLERAKERAMAGGMSEEEADEGISNLQSLSIIPFVELTAHKRPVPVELSKEEMLAKVMKPSDKSSKPKRTK